MQKSHGQSKRSSKNFAQKRHTAKIIAQILFESNEILNFWLLNFSTYVYYESIRKGPWGMEIKETEISSFRNHKIRFSIVRIQNGLCCFSKIGNY